MIVTEHLSRDFDLVRAVDDLSLTVQPGEVLGFLGPNGAGKSTTMKMLAGFLAPTRGRASVCGYDVVSEPRAARAALGYLPEGAPSYGEMTPASFLRFVAAVRGLRGDWRRKCLDDTIGRLQLGGVLHQPIATLSKGFRRRVGLAQALLHDPPVLILDEPTDGLDPNQKHEVRALINHIAASKTIIVSTHILEEVAPVCTRAAIIAGGRLLVDETPAALLARSRYRNAVRVSLAESGVDARHFLRELDGVKVVEAAPDGHSWTVFGEDGLDTAERVRACCNEHGWTVLALRTEGGRLDDVFRDLTMADPEAAA